MVIETVGEGDEGDNTISWGERIKVWTKKRLAKGRKEDGGGKDGENGQRKNGEEIRTRGWTKRGGGVEDSQKHGR